ncbi:hypothetical protein [Pediococcus damnosus]|nr:hypothetical protein [Pediococcus damnosus]
MKRGLLLTILTITSMCLINSPIRGDTHVSEVTSEGRVGFTKGTISPSYPPSDLRPADKVPNGPDTTIKPTVPVSAAKKQQFLPQTDEESDGILQVFGSLGFVVVAWYWMKKNQVRRHNQKN